MAPESSRLSNVRLEDHPTARNRAISVDILPSGSTIVSVPALTTILLPDQKGQRCDACLRHKSESIHLMACTGCRSYWYCGRKCQDAQWRRHHKKICKQYNQYIASTSYQALPPNEKLDAQLLSHLVAELFCSSDPGSGPLELLIEGQPTPFSTFSSLIAGPVVNQSTPSVCPMGRKDTLMEGVLDELYSRFGNNNFAIHSHLVSVAHGIFPLASRLFNHSCVPNAVAKYIFEESEPVRMDVVALRDINDGEEICLPYLDPALYQSRRQIFNLTYGFTCICPSCTFAQTVEPIPDLPQSSNERDALIKSLREFVFPSLNTRPFSISLPEKPYEVIPNELLPALHESFLGGLSEQFSTTSHDGPYNEALDVGLTILAIYTILYPPNYPQIGMHLLEMAKTAWNALVREEEQSTHGNLEAQIRVYIASSRGILRILGPEGDPEGGPLVEIQTVNSLLENE